MSGIYDISGNEISDVSYLCTRPEDYGAVGDGVTDDAVAIQQAVNNAGWILFATGKTYRVASTIRVKKNTIIDLNGATIDCATGHLFYNFASGATTGGYTGNGDILIKNGKIVGGAISFIHGKDIRFENVCFYNSLNDHFMEICACKNFVLDGCLFSGMTYLTTSVMEYINIDPCYFGPFPWNQNNESFYDGTINNGITIQNCTFELGEGSYSNGYNAIGVHVSDGSQHQNIKIINNKISGFTGCGLRINNMNDVVIANNVIELTASGANGIRVGDVSRSTKVVIKGNIITSNGTAITKSSNSTVLQSSDNEINPTYS